MQQFNKITVYSNIIKNLLASTYLPLVRTVRQGDYLCEGRLYILKCEIIKCTSSGYIGSEKYLSNTPIAKWDTIGEFHFGDKDGKLSTNYISNAEGYDYRTHERLGQYLRNLRDMYGLNLLPLYNCFSNQPLENHVIRDKKVVKTSETGEVKVYKVPIRFNQDYTICIENIGNTTLAPAFIRHNSLLLQNNTAYGNGVNVTNQYISLHYGENVRTYANTSFGRPIKVRFNNIPETKEVVFRNFTRGEEQPSEDPVIEAGSEKPVYFDKGTIYYERSGTSPNYIYTPTEDRSPYYMFAGRTFESGVGYFEDKGQFFIKTTDATPQTGKTYYYIAKDYYTVTTKLYKSDKAVYEITNEVCSQFADVESKLYLLIQVPKTFNQNIVVLEGDYTGIESQKIVDYLWINDLPDFLYDDFYTHDLNLMLSTSTEPRPFSPVLIEYLLWNAISNLDTINNDFDRISNDLYYKYIPNTADIKTMYPNFWVDRYRQIISDYIKENSTNVIQDNIGYITTEVERFMNKDVI